MKRLAIVTLFALTSGTALAQETMYITDILQLGLFQTEDGSGSPIRNLVSGTELTVTGRVPNFARVRTPDGDEGWVKSLYLVEEKPAQLRVAEVDARAARLEQELAEAIVARDAAAAEARTFVADAEREVAVAAASRDTLARLQQENTVYEERLELYRGALPWPWVTAALVLVLVGGFVAGYWWLDASIRRRHGGFRVY